MRAVLQRVLKASVSINNEIYSQINNGLLVFVGVEETDSIEDITWLTKKITQLRIFNDNQEIMNLSVFDINAEILVISQFTLHALTKKGNRPSYINAAPANISEPIYNRFVDELKLILNKKIKTGIFGEDMKVELINDGPVTIYIDTKRKE